MKTDDIEARLKSARPLAPSPEVRDRIMELPNASPDRRPALLAIVLLLILGGELEDRLMIERLRQSPVLNPHAAEGRR